MKLGTQHLNAFSKVNNLVWQRTRRASNSSFNNSSLERPSVWILKPSRTLGSDPGWRFSYLLTNAHFQSLTLLCGSQTQERLLPTHHPPGSISPRPSRGASKTSFLNIRCAHRGHKGDQYRRPGEADVRSNFQKLREAGPQMELHSTEKDSVKNESPDLRISRLLTFTFTHVTPSSRFLVHSAHQKNCFSWRKEQMKQCRGSYRSSDHPPRSWCWRSHPKDTQQ